MSGNTRKKSTIHAQKNGRGYGYFGDEDDKIKE